MAAILAKSEVPKQFLQDMVDEILNKYLSSIQFKKIMYPYFCKSALKLAKIGTLRARCGRMLYICRQPALERYLA
jgi:hypothetical protein